MQLGLCHKLGKEVEAKHEQKEEVKEEGDVS
jgi:hypothetical protein